MGLYKDIKTTGKKVLKEKATSGLKGVATSVLGKGVLGKTATKLIDKKFKKKSGSNNSPVADAIDKQNTENNLTNTTLARIEGIVLNISDNIYNIAGAMGARLSSMKEAQLAAQQQNSLDAAKQEESQTELIGAINPAATGGAKPDSEGGEKKGLIGSLLDNFKGVKGAFGSIVKKVALVGGGLLIAAGGITAAFNMFSKSDDEADAAKDAVLEDVIASVQGDLDAPEKEESSTAPTNISAPPPSVSSAPIPSAPSTSAAPAYSEQSKPATTAPAASPSPPPTGPTNNSVTTPPVEKNTAPAATPLPPQNTPAATSSSVVPPLDRQTQMSVAGTRAYQLEEVKVGLERSRENGLKMLKRIGKDTPERVQKMNEKYDKEIEKVDLEIKEKKQVMSGDFSGVAPSASPSTPSATPVAPSVSTGADVGKASVAVEAAMEAPPAPVVNNVSQSSSTDTSGDELVAEQIPTPVANRGSLDAGNLFQA
jgi:hypothetical protein